MINLKYPVSKAHAAFLFSVDTMYEKWPKSIYMWTFTFKKYQPDWRAMARWADLHNKLKYEFPLLRGIRVVEVHPGRNFHGLSHGLHFHCLFNQRVSVHWIRRVASKYGFGNIDARRVTQEEAVYIGKYLTDRDQPKLGKGARRWGAIGGFTQMTKVRDIQIDSEFHRNMVKVQNAIKVCQLGPDVVHSIYVNTRLHGEYENWPLDRYYYSNASEDMLCPDKKLITKLPRSNRRTREQSMLRQAVMWKEQARRRALGHEGRTLEDWQRRNEKKQAAGGGKIFYVPGDTRGNPGVKPGSGPVQEQDGTLSYYVDNWDKKDLKPRGTTPATNVPCGTKNKVAT